MAQSGNRNTSPSFVDDPLKYVQNIVRSRMDCVDGEHDEDRVFIDRIKGFARIGMPDELGIRPLLWQILLGYLPANPLAWPSTIESKRTTYRGFCDDLLPWNNEMTKLINKDVKRTLSSLHFFSEEHESGRKHQNSMVRLLSLYARLHPGTEYVQGMNEILAPIFFCFSSDPYAISMLLPLEDCDLSETDLDIEADTFFCFDVLMAEIHERFTLGLDQSQKGIGADFVHFDLLLDEADPVLRAHLSHFELHPKFYAFRWFTTLLSREFLLPDVLTLWDVVFSLEDRYTFLQRCCCSMLICIRDTLLGLDSFGDLISVIQEYPPTPVETIIENAFKLEGKLRDLHEEQRRMQSTGTFKGFLKRSNGR